jgi:signal transduction protein with GAF and PtsI domain
MRKNVIFELLLSGYLKPMDITPFKDQVKDFISLSLDRCMESVKARSGSVFLFDKTRKELVLEIVNNKRRKKLEGIREGLGEGIAGMVALERKPLLVRNIDKEIPLDYIRNHNNYKSKSFLSIPLELSGHLIGVVNITDKTRGGVFDDEDLHIVLDMSIQLGIALVSLTKYLAKQKKTQEKLAEELRILKESANRSQKFSSLGKLVGGLVHEVNNPLDGVIRWCMK